MESTVAAVVSNIQVTPRVWQVRLVAPGIAAESAPGQFVMVSCATGSGLFLRRPISISGASRTTGEIVLLYTVVGKGTSKLASVASGGSLNVIGPLGHGYDIRNSSRKVLLIAGGIGVAPLLFLAQIAVASGRSVSLIHGVPTASELCTRSNLPEGVSCRVTTDDGSFGTEGRATDLIAECTTGIEQIFACGPQNMYRSMSSDPTLRNCGADVQVSLEVRMACGFGVCNGCTVLTRSGPRKVCTDGPVFGLDDVIWDSVSLWS
jgi:dihydroorotate dehydrogenase electron transfer subunit